MATYEITKDGKTFDVEVPEGQDPNQVLAGITGAEAPQAETSLGKQALRGAGLAVRTVGGAIPKTFAGLADLAGTVINAGDRGLQNLFGFDNPSPIPVNNVETLDQILDQFLPKPESLPERIAAGAGEMAFTGGAGAAALAPKAGSILPSPSTQGVARNLADDIGQFFANKPIKSGVIEAGGGAGASTAAELSQEAELGPAGQAIATIAGGLAGGVAPQAGLNLSRKAATGAINFADAAFSGERRAAKGLQAAAADPEAAAKAALAAPEGVSPARASGEEGVRALESKVLADDPVTGARVARELEGAETKTLKDISESFGPKTNREEWQQEVIVRAAPDGAEIRVGQPDEMLDDAIKGFDRAYDDAKGFPVRTENVQVQGGNVSLREGFAEATGTNTIIADKKWRKGIANFLDGLLDDLSRQGKPVGSADSGVAEVDSAMLLEMRSTIRAQARARTRAGVNNPRAAAEAEMLNEANRAITEVIESQLPDAASASLKATDLRYKDFQTVQSAVLRSGEKGLTPEALKASLRARGSQRDVARGKTGDLGKLAETGRDAAATLGKPQEAARLTRNMTPEQLQTAKADFNEAIIQKASPGTSDLNGKKYLAQIDAAEESLLAAGFTAPEISQMRQVGRTLQMIQSRSPGAVQALLTDDVGTVMRFMAAVAGSKSGARLLKLLGGASGAGPSLIVAQYGSKIMQGRLTALSVDKADEMIRAAMVDKELFAALMTRPTDTVKKQADAARVMQAWLARTTPDETEDE